MLLAVLFDALFVIAGIFVIKSRSTLGRRYITEHQRASAWLHLKSPATGPKETRSYSVMAGIGGVAFIVVGVYNFVRDLISTLQP